MGAGDGLFYNLRVSASIYSQPSSTTDTLPATCDTMTTSGNGSLTRVSIRKDTGTLVGQTGSLQTLSRIGATRAHRAPTG